MSQIDERDRWFRRLKRCFRDMPADCEIMIHVGGNVVMSDAGEREREFHRTGHVDNVQELDSFTTDRVYPCSESL